MDKRKSRPSSYLCSDIDGASDAQLAQVRELVKAGSFTVASGRSPRNLHLYVQLDEPLEPAELEAMNRRLVALVGGDPSPAR